MEPDVRTCDRGGLVAWEGIRVGVMRAEVVEGVPFAQAVVFAREGDFECILERGREMEFDAGVLVLLDVQQSAPEPSVTLSFTPRQPA